MSDMSDARSRMVDTQIARRGVHDRHVLAAMREVPREKFVDAGFEDRAYEDAPLPIGAGQTISQPYIVALMLEAVVAKSGDRLLDIGAGSGYAAAVASRLVRQVHAIERQAELIEPARTRFDELGYDNIQLRLGDGTKGWPDAAPFDAIVVAACGGAPPRALTDQLDIGGRLVMPIGNERHLQRLLKFTRVSATRFDEEDLGSVMFVPLIQ